MASSESHKSVVSSGHGDKEVAWVQENVAPQKAQSWEISRARWEEEQKKKSEWIKVQAAVCLQPG